MVKEIQNLAIPTLPFEGQNESQFYLHIPFLPDKKFSPNLVLFGREGSKCDLA